MTPTTTSERRVDYAAGVTEYSSSWKLLTAAGLFLPRVLLYGPPGTGKTHIASIAGVKLGLPTYRVVLTEDTPAAELRGFYVPKGDTWEWQDGPAMLAYRNGGRLVADEITRATDDALSFMLGLLDGMPMTLPNGDIVTPHEDFSVWATTNDDPSALTDALADRFTVRVKTDQVNPEALALLPPGIAQAVSTSGAGISLREAQEFNRLLPIVGEAIAARFIWESRARDVLTGLDIAERLN